MSDEDKTTRRAVRAYLEAIDAVRPRRGRRRTPESINNRLAAIEADFDTASVLKRVELAQERINLQAELAAVDDVVDIDALRAEFIAHAKTYGATRTPPISYGAWRAVGIDPATLAEAGITRST